MRDPRNPKTAPQPIDLFRDDGVTAYSHDVQVDSEGHRLGLRRRPGARLLDDRQALDPLKGVKRHASAFDPIPYAGGRFTEQATADGFMHNSYRRGNLLMATAEVDAPPDCETDGRFMIGSLKGSYQGQAWKSTKEKPFRLKTVGLWSPHAQEGTLVNDTIYCSAHYFDVKKNLVAYSWYDQGTRILDISNPAKPIQVAYYRPDGGVSWAPYFHRGYIYVADHERGVEVLKADPRREVAPRVAAPRPSRRHVRMVRASSRNLQPDPKLGWLCPIPAPRRRVSSTPRARRPEGRRCSRCCARAGSPRRRAGRARGRASART